MLKGATIYFYCLFDESHFSNICTDNGIYRTYWLCKHMKKIRSSQPDIPVLNWVKHQSFPVGIVNRAKFFMFVRRYSSTRLLFKFFYDVWAIAVSIFCLDFIFLKILLHCLSSMRYFLQKTVFSSAKNSSRSPVFFPLARGLQRYLNP